jgi:hypothetical protein
MRLRQSNIVELEKREAEKGEKGGSGVGCDDGYGEENRLEGVEKVQ